MIEALAYACVSVAAVLVAWLSVGRKRSAPLRYLDHTNVRISVSPDLTKEWADELRPWVEWARWPSINKKPPGEPPLGGVQAALVEVARGGLFRVVRESWLVTPDKAIRESDGAVADAELHARLRGVIAVAEARAAQLVELAKL